MHTEAEIYRDISQAADLDVLQHEEEIWSLEDSADLQNNNECMGQIRTVETEDELVTPIEATEKIETYGGPYEVDPDFTGTTLGTSGKKMTDNVKVNAIKVERVSNLSGGTTVYIGGVING